MLPARQPFPGRAGDFCSPVEPCLDRAQDFTSARPASSPSPSRHLPLRTACIRDACCVPSWTFLINSAICFVSRLLRRPVCGLRRDDPKPRPCSQRERLQWPHSRQHDWLCRDLVDGLHDRADLSTESTSSFTRSAACVTDGLNTRIPAPWRGLARRLLRASRAFCGCGRYFLGWRRLVRRFPI